MIGPLEIAIIVLIALVFFGYRYLPGLGRKAGTGARDLKDSVQEMVGDKADPSTIGKSAGKGMREVSRVPRRAYRQERARAEAG